MMPPPLTAARSLSRAGPAPRASAAPPRPGGLSPQAVYDLYEKRSLSYVQKLQLDAWRDTFNGLAQDAWCRVMNGESDTPAARAWLRDPGSRTGAAKLGTAVHAEFKALVAELARTYPGVVELVQDSSQPSGQLTATFQGRPDLRVVLGPGQEALFDLTSPAEARRAHTLGRNYDAVPQVVYLGEVTYNDVDQRRC